MGMTRCDTRATRRSIGTWAIWLANDNSRLYRKINRRLWWLYVAVGGAVTMLAAIAALHWARLA